MGIEFLSPSYWVGTGAEALTGAPKGQYSDPLGIWGLKGQNQGNLLDMSGFKDYPEYQQGFTPGMMDNSGLDRFRQEALRTGPSAWQRMSKVNSAAQQENEREKARKLAMGQKAAAMDDLAARGGLSSGARERAGESANKNFLNMSQDLTRQGNLNDLQLGINDEQNRIAQLGSLPGMQMQSIKPMVEENQRRGDYNIKKTDAYNKHLGDMKQAQAIQSSGGGGGLFDSYICTVLEKSALITKQEELDRLNELKMRSIFTRADGLVWYLRKGEKLASNLLNGDYNLHSIKFFFVDDILRIWDEKGLVEAQNQYARKAGELFCRMDPNCGYKESMSRPGTLKSLIHLPILFLLPQSWAWVGKTIMRKLFKGKLNVARAN